VKVRLFILSLIALLLVACSTTPVLPSEVKPYPYSLTVDVQAGDTQAALEARYNGKVVLWQPKDGFAVLGLNQAAAESFKQNLDTMASGSSSLETNPSVFYPNGTMAWFNGSVSAWSGGSVSAWSGGSVSAWSGGSVSAWSGGSYLPLPQNTAKWNQIRLQQAQDIATNLGAGIKVAVIDSGVDLAHPGLKGGFVAADQMWDYVGNDAVPNEVGVLGIGAYGHGTNVASIILQIAPKAKIMPIRVLGPDGSGDVLNVASAITFAVNKGAKVINLSLGSSVASAAVTNAINAATSKGVYVISSSGNEGIQQITYPATQASADTTTAGKFSVSVGSVNSLDEKSTFSTYGLTLEMVAPGEVVYGPVPGNRLGAWSGTSMAAPMISGTIALALAQTLYTPRSLLTDMLESRAGNIYQGGLNAAYEDSANNIQLLGEGRLDVEHFIYDVTRP
jgi:thermitase